MHCAAPKWMMLEYFALVRLAQASIHLSWRHRVLAVQSLLRGLPQSLQSGKHMTPVHCDAPHHHTVRWERADSPECFAVVRQRQRLFAKLLLQRAPFRGAWTHARDAEGCPRAIRAQAAERLRRASARLDAHAFTSDGLAECDDVCFHFHRFVRK